MLLLVRVLFTLVDVLGVPLLVGTFLILLGLSFDEVVERVPLVVMGPFEVAVGVWVGATSGTGEMEAPFTEDVSKIFSGV